MARALIVGCGCRGRELGAAAARARAGRCAGRAAREERAGGDRGGRDRAGARRPRPAGTVLDLVGDVAVVFWLLGSAAGRARGASQAIHGPRLERLLERLVDTPVRGFVYEAAGSVDPERPAGGESSNAARTWRIPVAVVEPPEGPEPGRGDARGDGSWPDLRGEVEIAKLG